MNNMSLKKLTNIELRAMKLILLELHSEILNNSFVNLHEATGSINNYVEQIDDALESGVRDE